VNYFVMLTLVLWQWPLSVYLPTYLFVVSISEYSISICIKWEHTDLINSVFTWVVTAHQQQRCICPTGL